MVQEVYWPDACPNMQHDCPYLFRVGRKISWRYATLFIPSVLTDEERARTILFSCFKGSQSSYTRKYLGAAIVVLIHIIF